MPKNITHEALDAVDAIVVPGGFGERGLKAR